jgi:methylmalonyl-CoA epimerase
MLGRIDHIGVATEDLEGAIALYEGILGMPVSHRETVESQGVEAVLLDVGEGHVELLRPLGEDTPVGKYLAKKGPGLHHVAYAVADIDETLSRLKETGVTLIDQEPRRGIQTPGSPSCIRRQPAECSPRSSSQRRDTDGDG